MVKLWIANTDNDWFDFLSARADLDEVNFWQPSGRTDFHAIQPGELFLFRLKSPRNMIGGFGVFEHASRLPLSLAWEAFGTKNGASSFDEMRQRISRYVESEIRPDHVLGCRIVTQPVFLPELAWIPLPPSWTANVQVGKVYRTDSEEGRRLWDQVMEAGLRNPTAPVFEPAAEQERARFGDPVLIKPRLVKARSELRSPMRIKGSVRSLAARSFRHLKRHTSSPTAQAGGTISAMEFSCGPTFTACSTRATRQSIPTFGSSSAIGSNPISTTETNIYDCTARS